MDHFLMVLELIEKYFIIYLGPEYAGILIITLCMYYMWSKHGNVGRLTKVVTLNYILFFLFFWLDVLNIMSEWAYDISYFARSMICMVWISFIASGYYVNQRPYLFLICLSYIGLLFLCVVQSILDLIYQFEPHSLSSMAIANFITSAELIICFIYVMSKRRLGSYELAIKKREFQEKLRELIRYERTRTV